MACDGARTLSSPQKENPLPQTQLNPFKILFILTHSSTFLWLRRQSTSLRMWPQHQYLPTFTAQCAVNTNAIICPVNYITDTLCTKKEATACQISKQRVSEESVVY